MIFTDGVKIGKHLLSFAYFFSKLTNLGYGPFYKSPQSPNMLNVFSLLSVLFMFILISFSSFD